VRRREGGRRDRAGPPRAEKFRMSPLFHPKLVTGRPRCYRSLPKTSRDFHRPVIFNSIPIGFTYIE
jgi:hypothetical protein